ncbi:hypothetical protein ACGFZQ_50070 [Streptomyces sp. NPDC048254]|uniref:hypothetical protein n=1 Tax=Streptomyces sp. NPDC048254 TaxID=3365525 RepID=UPI00371E8363
MVRITAEQYREIFARRSCLLAGSTGREEVSESDLRMAVSQLMDAAGLQRGRLRGIVLKGDDAVAADTAAEQLSLDPRREARLVMEGAADRVRARFGPHAIGPAGAARRAS